MKTQEKRNTFLTSVPVPMLKAMVDEDKVSIDKKPSPELFEMIQAAANSLMSFGGLWKSIKKKGHDEGFSERELEDILRPLLKPQLNKDQIYYLFHKEEQIERVKSQSHRKFTTDAPKKEPEQNITPPEKPPEPEPEHKGANAFDYKPEPEEDPKDLEIQFLKEQNAELQDALKQTEQFKPATELQQINLTDPNNLIEKAVMKANQLTEEQARDMTMEVVKQAGLAVPETNVESVTNWLKKQADGIHSFYYDTYGIDLFKNRELSQLKNSGVKVFKRLYFEV